MPKAAKSPVKNTRKRSCAYPLFPLSEAVVIAKKIHDGMGSGPFSRLTLAKGLGYSSFSGAVSAKIGALVHFGLLSRLRGLYSLTQLARDVFTYPEEGSGPAMVAAARHPVLFEKLIDRFWGAPLPGGLAALLEVDFGITGKAAPLAAKNFITTLEVAGLLRDGILAPAFEPEDGLKIPAAAAPAVSPPPSKKERVIKIELPSGITLVFPEELSYRLSLGEFAPEIKSLDEKTGGYHGDLPES